MESRDWTGWKEYSIFETAHKILLLIKCMKFLFKNAHAACNYLVEPED